MMKKTPGIEIIKKEISHQMSAIGYKRPDRSTGVYVRPTQNEMQLFIGFPTARAFTYPPVADVGPIVGLTHVPTERLYRELSELAPSKQVVPTVSYSPHQIDAERFKASWLFPLDSTVPSKVAQMVEEVTKAACVLTERYPTPQTLVEATYTNPFAYSCRRPIMLLVLGRTREARAFAEYGMKELKNKPVSENWEPLRRLFCRIIERAEAMEKTTTV